MIYYVSKLDVVSYPFQMLDIIFDIQIRALDQLIQNPDLNNSSWKTLATLFGITEKELQVEASIVLENLNKLKEDSQSLWSSRGCTLEWVSSAAALLISVPREWFTLLKQILFNLEPYIIDMNKECLFKCNSVIWDVFYEADILRGEGFFKAMPITLKSK